MPLSRTGTVKLPMHYGHAPRWLFNRMVKLTEQIFLIIAESFGPEEILRRLADPLWFQGFGSILGFDWHSSGLTTTTTGAVRLALDRIGPELGLFAAGGKGKTSLLTPTHIINNITHNSLSLNPEKYVNISRLVAKIDNTLVQDGFTLYHHFFMFRKTGEWIVVQQGLNYETRYARRYHWASFLQTSQENSEGTISSHISHKKTNVSHAQSVSRLGEKNSSSMAGFIDEQKNAVISDIILSKVLNLAHETSKNLREAILDFVSQNPDKGLRLYKNLQDKIKDKKIFPRREYIDVRLDIRPENFKKILITMYEKAPENFEELVLVKGAGPKTFRALALIGELIYGPKASWQDPVKYTFAHGGKDGYPYPVNKEDYDRSIEILEQLAFKLKDKKAKGKVVQLLTSWQKGA